MRVGIRGKIFGLLAGIALLLTGLTARPMFAHHAFAAEFDADKPVKLEGPVTKMDWSNPHAWIYMDVKGPDGKVANWGIETGAPNALLRRGFTKNSLLPGTVIIVEGYKAKDGSTRANGSTVTLPDGKKLFLGSSGNGSPYDEKK
jgi:Family of unknown function (DUF6152)